MKDCLLESQTFGLELVEMQVHVQADKSEWKERISQQVSETESSSGHPK